MNRQVLAYEILSNRDLEISLRPGEFDEDEIRDMLEDPSDLWDLMEHDVGNGGPYPTDAGEQYRDGRCNLTDAPMVVTGKEWPDSGRVSHWGTVWWFPNYMVEDPVETLLRTGRVVFTFGYEVGRPTDCAACDRSGKALGATAGCVHPGREDRDHCPACEGRGFTLAPYSSIEEWFRTERSVFH